MKQFGSRGAVFDAIIALGGGISRRDWQGRADKAMGLPGMKANRKIYKNKS
ncbi:hypothetical protein HYX10_02500 [Candidatus Woesearchaeota archaeon]|nr:hypothetical protein [Candidatus Woesearchaeota archaeon]